MNKFIEKFSLEGKKAIVTGGAKGLCNGMAQALHDAGAEVVLLDILDIVEDSAKEMAKEGAMVHAVKGDLSEIEAGLWKIQDEGETPTYLAQWDYKNSYYRISGRITRDEIENIIKDIVY